MAKEEEERKYVFSKFYKICIVILIIIGIIVSPVYPELMIRMVIGIVLAIGVFFGLSHISWNEYFTKAEIYGIDIFYVNISRLDIFVYC